LRRIHHYVETHFSTEQPATRKNARLPRAHGHQERTPRVEATPRQRKKATHTFALLRVSALFGMRNYLRDSREFQHVYRNGKRYDGVLITVFVIENQGLQHRLGVTASKKALGKAVQRNRAKRLLRETFRSNEPSLRALSRNYDWVLNAKAAVLNEKVNAPERELAGIIEKVFRLETRDVPR
jgi:ribonuclease P protein component